MFLITTSTPEHIHTLMQEWKEDYLIKPVKTNVFLPEEDQICNPATIKFQNLKNYQQYNGHYAKCVGSHTDMACSPPETYYLVKNKLLGDPMFISRNNLVFYDDKIDVVIIDIYGNMYDIRVEKPNISECIPVMVYNLHFQKEYQVFEVQDSAKDRKSGWWASLSRPQNTNLNASILTNQDLGGNCKDYILLNLDFSPLKIEEAIKVKATLDIFSLITEFEENMDQISTQITLENIDTKLKEFDLTKQIYGATEQWLVQKFSECFIREEGYVFVDDFLM